MKKLIKHSLNQIPYVKRLIRRNRELEQAARTQDEETAKLRSRNEEWAAEVRELRGDDQSQKILWSVEKNDLIKIDSRSIKQAQTANPSLKKKPPFRINWVIPAGNPNDGGIINIFRFIKYLSEAGHQCQIYIYDPLNSLSDRGASIKTAFAATAGNISYGVRSLADCDAVFATNWYTAYPVFNFQTKARKFYFIQDFEPYFYPVGAESSFAENTYKFGFHGITAGAWLAKKLSKEYGMKVDHYDFGSDFERYSYLNSKKRTKIFFYARPVSPRRGFQLGMAALELFHKQFPNYEIVLAGWDLSRYQLPSGFKDLKTVPLDKLNEVYNQCAAGLVLSFTNMSLLPLELMAAGCIPLVNDQSSNRLVSDNPYIKYVKPYPEDIANGLSEIVNRPDLVAYGAKAAASASGLSWDAAGAKVDKIVTRELYG